MNKLRLRNGQDYIFDHTEIMGIVNITEDSFYASSRTSTDTAYEKAVKLINEGATVIDLGAQSSRPGSHIISSEEEIEKLIPVIKTLKKNYPDILISVDTYYAHTASAVIEAGADIINDISAMRFDENMVNVIKEFQVPIILMHSLGTFETMHEDYHYDDVVKDVYHYFEERIDYCIRNGISKESLMIDLGIGFSKSMEDNKTLLKHIDTFDQLGVPQLVAVSRKRVIGIDLSPEGRLPGTIGLSVYATMHHIPLIRVHDVKENRQAIELIEELL